VAQAGVLGPGGDYQHRPLRLVWINLEDLILLEDAAVVLGLALALDPHGELGDAITAGAEAAGIGCRPPPAPARTWS
jgi:hypothetical protein